MADIDIMSLVPAEQRTELRPTLVPHDLFQNIFTIRIGGWSIATVEQRNFFGKDTKPDWFLRSGVRNLHDDAFETAEAAAAWFYLNYLKREKT